MFRWVKLFACAAVLMPSMLFAASPKLDESPEAVFEADDLISVEEELVEATNAERVRRGLRPLEVCRKLMSTARRHTAWMANRRSMTHGRYPVAENIASGQNTTRQAISAWMNSSGHRANMLNPNNTKMGVAAYQAANGQVYWTQQFTR